VYEVETNRLIPLLTPLFFAGKIFLIHPYSIISRTGAFHKEFDTDRKPHLLKKALERCEAKGWIVRVREIIMGRRNIDESAFLYPKP
jgi:hypothetical protein